MWLTGEPDGSVIPAVYDPVAQKMLELPIFPTASGLSVSGQHLVDQFCAFGGLVGS